ncbi:SETMR methyltransferase, partial [Acromyrmex heyeri]
MEQRAVIKFNAKLGKSASETFRSMQQVYGSQCLDRTAVFEWHKSFLEGRETLEDDKKSGRPILVRTPEMIEKVRDFVANDRNASLKMMEEALNISRETIRTILHEDLDKTKVCAKFVPHTLRSDQKSARINYSRDIVAAAENNPNFLKSIVTGDETIHKEFVPTGQTIIGAYYLEVLKRLMGRIHRIRPEYRDPEDWSLLHDNAPSHTSLIVRQCLARNRISVLNHPPYSPDLAPCDFSLFPKLKLKLKGCFFDDIPTIQSASKQVLEAIPHTELEHAFESLLNRCNKCIEVRREYFE